MHNLYGQYRNGLKKALAGSFIFHVVVLSLGLLIFSAGKDRTFLSPVYVELVSGRPKANTAQEAPKNVELQKETVKKEAEKKEGARKEAVREKAAAKEKAEAKPKETLKVKDKSKASKEKAELEDTLKKVSENVKKKEEAAALEARLDSIRKKQETESKEVAKKLDALKKELGTRQTAKAGTQTDGAGSGKLLAAKYPAYYSVIRDKVQTQWIYPEGFNAENVSIIISIKIGRNGKLIDSFVEKSSGNTRFDESLLSAVKKASPFPPLPQDFQGSYLETGLRFCPVCKE